jgi:hypothetical protein
MFEDGEMRSTLRKIVLDRDEEYYEEDNVIYAKNAFLVNSVLCWYFDDRANTSLNAGHIGSMIDLLDKHINKEIILQWKEGNLQISRPGEPENKERKNEHERDSGT